MQTSKASPFLIAKTHVVYLRYGEHIGSQANQEMQGMLAAAAITTPSVAACGATNVWGNGPTAPPLGISILKQRREDASMTIGCIDMQTMHVGSLADKNKRVRNEHAIRSDRE